MNKISVIDIEDAVGCVLAHDMTQIIKGEKKGPRFKKGNIVKKEDIEVLKSMGKEHIYVLELDEDTYHEEEAAEHLANICAGGNIEKSQVSEGKINLIAGYDGLLKVDVDLLNKINSCPQVMVASKLNNTYVRKGEIVGGTRAIPLFIEKDKIQICQDIAKEDKILKILEVKNLRVGILTTGNEVFYGKVKDGFKDVLIEKLSKFNCEIIDHRYSTDDMESIEKNLQEMLDKKLDLILCTGGMSVDPDDNTPGAIRAVGSDIVSYGSPVLPGSMFMVAYKDETAILGLPGAVMYFEKTVFDFIMPRIAVKERITKRDIVELGHGGLL
ncbi:MAG: molybdopterin-binding protein [Peptoniphilaceae bacterium]